ncbi:MAG: 4-(cytidine 5'-diphospho)-2-C-methyl-D-erythritol kinase [Chloroflexi bacterium]|nr:4-(cytidine 5'-diphospho)-2-C-methyl-D-erythritol kinase [Chloroflexota bacterium]
MTAARLVKMEAHAKVNLTLEVLGKRPDGYHNIVSIMQTVDLHDDIELAPARDLDLECNDPSLAGEANLALKAANLLRAASGVSAGVRIRLDKRIPVAAGLGGGSSDAAAVLSGLNRLWGLDWPAGRLRELAVQLGADVTFFLHGGTALVQGKGEDVVQLPPPQIDWVVILSPEIHLPGKTRKMFSLVTPDLYTRGVLSHKLAGRIRGGGDTPEQFLFNAFDQIAAAAFTDLERYRAAFKAVGAREVVLCGAGPSMFAVAPTREIGLAWQLLLKSKGTRAYLTRRWSPPASPLPRDSRHP